LRVIPNAQALTLRKFLLDCVMPGSVVVTDGLSPYPMAIGHDYLHDPHPIIRSSNPAHISLPDVHRVASLLKRWWLGTHQGAIRRRAFG